MIFSSKDEVISITNPSKYLFPKGIFTLFPLETDDSKLDGILYKKVLSTFLAPISVNTLAYIKSPFNHYNMKRKRTKRSFLKLTIKT